MPTLANLQGRMIPSHKLKLKLHLSHKIVNNGQDMMSPSNVKDVVDLAMLKKTVTPATILPHEVEVVVAEEEVVVHLEAVEEEVVVANIRTTPHQSLKVHHLNLNLNHNHSPLSRPHNSPKRSSPNHSKQIQSRSQMLQSLKAYWIGELVIWPFANLWKKRKMFGLQILALMATSRMI
jgi:hypothetical protein